MIDATSEWNTGDIESEYICKPVTAAQIATCSGYINGLRFETSISNLKEALDKLQAIVAEEDFDQTVVVEEECTELIKEICKLRRGKGNRENLLIEAADVVTACMVYNQVCGGSFEDLIEKTFYKINRAIERYEDNGEM